MVRGIILAYFLIAVSIFVDAQIVSNAKVISYLPKDYGFHNQTWRTVQNDQGVIFMANGDGVIVYDGYNWDLIVTETKTNVLSIGITENQEIYYCGVGEVGILVKNDLGSYEAQQFVNDTYQNEIEAEFFWYLHVFGDNVVFQSANYWLIYDQKELKVTPANDLELNESFKVDDFLWFQDNHRNLYQVHHDSLQFYTSKNLFSYEEKFNVKAIEKWGSNKLIFATYENGLKLCDSYSKTLDHFGSDLDILGYTVESAKVLPNKDIVILTENSGLLILNQFGKVKSNLNINNGLLTNHIRNVFLDREGLLWLNSSEGIHKVLLNKNYTLFSKQFENVIGNPNSIIEFSGDLYIGTNKGVYVLSNENGVSEIKAIPEFKKQVFDLMVVDNEILCASTSGVYSIRNKKIEIIKEPFYARALAKFTDELLLVGGRNELGVFEKRQGQWELTKETLFPDEFLHLEQDPTNENVFWGGMFSSGAVQIILDTSLNSLTYKHYNPDMGEHSGYILPFSVNNEMVFAPKVEKIFSFDENNEEFVDHQLTQDYINGSYSSWLIKEDIFGNLFYELSGPVWILNKTIDGYEVDSTSLHDLDVGYINDIYCGDDGLTWLVAENDLICFNPTTVKKGDVSFSALINRVVINNERNLIDNFFSETPNFCSNLQFAFKENNISFGFVAPVYSYESSLEYSYMLEGNDESFSGWTTDKKAVYTNLNEGKYKFVVKAKTADGNISKEAYFEFEILAPWYRTLWAYTLYVILALTLLYAVIKINSIRLKKANERLQNLVNQKTQEISNNLNQISKQKDQLEEVNKDIIDSINYAKRLQLAILPPLSKVQNMFEDYFVLYLPKDIVAGDFYWVKSVGTKVLFAAADCTGHGVPGALVSVVCNDALKRSVNEFKLTKPSLILDRTNEMVSDSFNNLEEDVDDELLVKDGMDIALCSFDWETNVLNFSGANNPLWILSQSAMFDVESKVIHQSNGLYLHEFKATRQPVGWYDNIKPFENIELKLSKGDRVYLFSDGFVDQFGEVDGKVRKLKRKNFAKVIIEHCEKPMQDQQKMLLEFFNQWKVDQEQIDDVTVLGIKI